MVMRVEHVEGEYRVVLSAEAMEAMNLTAGAEVEIRPVTLPALSDRKIRYISVEEALESYHRTEPLHSNTYRELAK